MKLENLTKENFFNRMQQQYPEAMEIFCNWIDEYKKAVNWNSLFNSNSDFQDSNGKNAPALKYYDLPLAMQYGIWLQFINEYALQNKIGICSVGRGFTFQNVCIAIETNLRSINAQQQPAKQPADEKHMEWWKALTDTERVTIAKQYHEIYQFQLIKDLTESEIKHIYNRRPDYNY